MGRNWKSPISQGRFRWFPNLPLDLNCNKFVDFYVFCWEKKKSTLTGHIVLSNRACSLSCNSPLLNQSVSNGIFLVSKVIESISQESTTVFRLTSSYLYARLQTERIMVWWCPSVRPGLRPSVRHSFPHFSPTCFDILIWNFVYYFIFMHVRSSSNAIHFRHFLQELCSFLTSNSYKSAVFRTFLLHALTYWVQILYMTLF